MDADYDDIPVSRTDHLTADGGEAADEERKFGEYRPTNTPLPLVELEDRRKRGWPHRTAKTLHDITPLEEHEVLAH